MKEEIRLRKESPSNRGQSPRGSMYGLSTRVKRPSVGNILSQVPYVQQHLSEANLVTVCTHCNFQCSAICEEFKSLVTNCHFMKYCVHFSNKKP